jgi:hypothetical protein
MKDKRVIEKWSSEIEIKALKPSGFLKVHQDMREVMAHSIKEKEIENEGLKKRIRKMEEALTPKPLLEKPLVVMVP